MPVIDGKVVRARYSSLKLNELSSVDRPAQIGARATIMKRDGTSPVAAKGSWLARGVAKYVGSEDGAHTFQEVLRENKFSEAIWPMTDALSQSIRSIVGDDQLSAAGRDTKITTTVDEFLAAVRQLDPPTPDGEAPVDKVEKQLRELISKKDEPMPKTVAELVAENPALKAHIETIEGERDTAKAALTTEQTAHGETKKSLAAATEETFKTADGTEVKKSELGAAYPVLKASEQRAQLAVLEKRASTEFGHLPGTDVEKAAVLQHVEALPEETKKAALAIFASAEKMATAGFSRLGTTGEPSADVAKAKGDFNAKVAEIEKRDGCPRHEAMRKARTEHADLFEAMQDAEAAE